MNGLKITEYPPAPAAVIGAKKRILRAAVKRLQSELAVAEARLWDLEMLQLKKDDGSVEAEKEKLGG